MTGPTLQCVLDAADAVPFDGQTNDLLALVTDYIVFVQRVGAAGVTPITAPIIRGRLVKKRQNILQALREYKS